MTKIMNEIFVNCILSKMCALVSEVSFFASNPVYLTLNTGVGRRINLLEYIYI